MPRISTLRITRSHQIAAAVLVAAGSVTAIAATGGTSEAQTSAARSSVSVEPVAAAGIPTAKDAAEKAAEQKAAESAAAKKAADRAPPTRPPRRAPTSRPPTAPPSARPSRRRKFSNNLDGWIRESLDIMKKKNIPGSYEGLHRNIMRESSGNPNAVNDWDINARNGIPSKGLLQVIQPTFDAYHVKGTPKKLTDPVANITAAANYAADRYGSIDNVDSAY
ncbi:transglycosylase SLT domain-containing protein [Streptomyces globisporus]|uniref:Transglycosylase SLT domain-containing protein n=1 Tax=Streptomyces globisporus TaxID=1908 RepID=A0A927GPY3_STRGL|nr:transglycosylase SLT domain-containing protein [Streptomyces globisporus]